MKRYAFVLLLFLAFVFPKITSAETSTPSSPRKTLRQEIQTRNEERSETLNQKREEAQTRLEERKASREAQLTNLRRERIRLYWSRIHTRISALVERSERLISRIESRLAIIENNNKNIHTTKITSQLTDAKNLLALTKLDLTKADEKIEEALSSTNPQDAFKEVREIVSDIKANLKEVHRLLVSVIGGIKGLRVGQNDLNALPSVTPTP